MKIAEEGGMATQERLDPRYVNRDVQLPYGLEVAHIEAAAADTYRLLNGINEFLRGSGYRPLEELILGNSLSGLVSELLVKNIARVCPLLVANRKVGGHPDLLPRQSHESDEVLKGEDGIEVKASIQAGGWQGHNPEDCWVMVFRYIVGEQKGGNYAPLTFVEIMCAELAKRDWSFSGRKGRSRRTPTASITRSGVEKLRKGFLYRLPGYGVGRHRPIVVTMHPSPADASPSVK